MAQDVGLLIYLKTVIYIHIYMYCMRLLSQKLGLREQLFLILECVLSDPGFPGFLHMADIFINRYQSTGRQIPRNKVN